MIKLLHFITIKDSFINKIKLCFIFIFISINKVTTFYTNTVLQSIYKGLVFCLSVCITDFYLNKYFRKKTVNEMATEGRSPATTQRPETAATLSRD